MVDVPCTQHIHVKRTYFFFSCGTSLSLKGVHEDQKSHHNNTINMLLLFRCPVDLAVPFIRLKNFFSPVPNQNIRDDVNGQTYMFKCISPLLTIRNSYKEAKPSTGV